MPRSKPSTGLRPRRGGRDAAARAPCRRGPKGPGRSRVPRTSGRPIRRFQRRTRRANRTGGLRPDYAPDTPIEVFYHVKQGNAATEIVHMAEEVEAELIVVGTHGRTGLNWLLAGSVATSVMQRADCPVLALLAAPTGKCRKIHHPPPYGFLGARGGGPPGRSRDAAGTSGPGSSSSTSPRSTCTFRRWPSRWT